MVPLLTKVNQVSIVVKDAEGMAMRLHKDLGIGPWKFLYIESPPLIEINVRGKSQNFRLKVALVEIEEFMLELIEPMDEYSIFHEFLRDKGEGLHHIATPVSDIDAAVAEAEKKGLKVLSSAKWPNGKGGFAYLDTEKIYGMIIELLQRPAPEYRLKPYKYWPPQSKY